MLAIPHITLQLRIKLTKPSLLFSEAGTKKEPFFGIYSDMNSENFNSWYGSKQNSRYNGGDGGCEGGGGGEINSKEN